MERLSATRHKLLGCVAIDVVDKIDASNEPNRSFREAHDRIGRGDAEGAAVILEAITRMPGIEALHRVRAWQALRAVGHQPSSELAGSVLGVVVEVGLTSGNDLLAAYTDRTAHYYNYSGAGVVWQRPDASLDGPIDSVLASAATIVARIGPWNDRLRPPPTSGFMRLNILTPAGLHFGEGKFDTLDRDPLARPLVRSTTSLMKRLTAVTG
jgi:hypothetical protein